VTCNSEKEDKLPRRHSDARLGKQLPPPLVGLDKLGQHKEGSRGQEWGIWTDAQNASEAKDWKALVVDDPQIKQVRAETVRVKEEVASFWVSLQAVVGGDLVQSLQKQDALARAYAEAQLENSRRDALWEQLRESVDASTINAVLQHMHGGRNCPIHVARRLFDESPRKNDDRSSTPRQRGQTDQRVVPQMNHARTASAPSFRGIAAPKQDIGARKRRDSRVDAPPLPPSSIQQRISAFGGMKPGSLADSFQGSARSLRSASALEQSHGQLLSSRNRTIPDSKDSLPSPGRELADPTPTSVRDRVRAMEP